MEKTPLRFLDLSTRHIGVSTAVGAAFAEAACVCLDRHHSSPVDFHLVDADKFNGLAQATWLTTDARAKSAWANNDDATRDGAYGIAIATIEVTRGLVAVGRAETRTGADYYLSFPGQPAEDFEKAFRLEVSGIDNCTQSLMETRLNQKVQQAVKGNSNLPAIAAVVGFSEVKVAATDVENK